MVESVADYLNGRGHPVRRGRDVGLADETDAVIADYALGENLVIVTFDRDFRRAARRKGARCLHILPPERTARRRVAHYYREIVALLWSGEELVTVPADGAPWASD